MHVRAIRAVSLSLVQGGGGSVFRLSGRSCQSFRVLGSGLRDGVGFR